MKVSTASQVISFLVVAGGWVGGWGFLCLMLIHFSNVYGLGDWSIRVIVSLFFLTAIMSFYESYRFLTQRDEYEDPGDDDTETPETPGEPPKKVTTKKPHIWKIVQEPFGYYWVCGTPGISYELGVPVYDGRGETPAIAYDAWVKQQQNTLCSPSVLDRLSTWDWDARLPSPHSNK